MKTCNKDHLPDSKKLTLKEYISQQYPEYMPVVQLTPDEYEVLDTFTHRKGTPDEEERKIIKIKHFPDYRYMQRNGITQLYAIKVDDNCNDLSCFWI